MNAARRPLTDDGCATPIRAGGAGLRVLLIDDGAHRVGLIRDELTEQGHVVVGVVETHGRAETQAGLMVFVPLGFMAGAGRTEPKYSVRPSGDSDGSLSPPSAFWRRVRSSSLASMRS